jgi:phage terminase large subunit-like protein
MHKKFGVVSIVCDPTHFYQNIMAMDRDGLPIRELKQTTGNMVSASTALYEVLRMKRLEAYPDEELREHLRFAAAKVQGSGFRIVKKEESAKPNDGAIAMAMAVYDAIERGGVDTSKMQRISSPFSENTGFERLDEIAEEADWPEALRATTREDRVRALEALKGRRGSR